ASTSLPVPVSPWMSTLMSLFAIRTSSSSAASTVGSGTQRAARGPALPASVGPSMGTATKLLTGEAGRAELGARRCFRRREHRRQAARREHEELAHRSTTTARAGVRVRERLLAGARD